MRELIADIDISRETSDIIEATWERSGWKTIAAEKILEGPTCYFGLCLKSNLKPFYSYLKQQFSHEIEQISIFSPVNVYRQF